MIRTLFLLISIFICYGASATSNKVSYLSPTDTVWIELDANLQKYFEHEVLPKQTLYSLSKFYGLDILDIFDQNPYLKTTVLDVNDIVKVPIQNKIINTVTPSKKSNYAPVFYKVQKQDNLFKISRRYFDLSVKELMNNNKLKDYNLNIEQPLLIGWISVNGVKNQNPIHDPINQDPASLMGPFLIEFNEQDILVSKPEDKPQNNNDLEEDNLTVTSSIGAVKTEELAVSEADPVTKPSPTPIKREISSLRKKFEKEKTNYSYKEERGVAHWSKGIKHKTDLYVLHKTAPIGSTVQVINPLINKSIYAKVIAKMPANMYPSKVKVIVSPAIANLLGAIDSQFFVKVKYLAPSN